MRRLLGSVVLAALLFAALWFLRDRDDQGASPAPEVSVSPTSAPLLDLGVGPAASPAPTPSSTTNAEHDVAGEDEATAHDDEHVEGELVDPAAAAVPRDDAQADRFARYEQAAVDFLTAFARPADDLATQAWWANVSSRLTEQAAADYEGTDPRQVPFTPVTPPAPIMPSAAPAELLTIARVETDGGVYLVEMQTGPDGILVARAVPERTGGQP